MKKSIFSIIALFLVFSSCGKDESQNTNDGIESTGETETRATTISFNQANASISTSSSAESLFGVNISGWDSGLGSIDANRFKINLPAGVGTSVGMEGRFDITDNIQYVLKKDLKFVDNFSFSKGGKVGWGFAIGDGVTGGRNTEATIDNKGGSFRLMWRTDSGGAYLHPYVYYKDMTGQFGTDFISKKYYISDNTTYNVRLTIKTNTSSTRKDGVAKMEVKCASCSSYTTVWSTTAIRWSGNSDSNARKIKTFYFSTFRGGSDSTWEGKSGTQGIFFDNLSWTTTL